jgi:hypothetical protein
MPLCRLTGSDDSIRGPAATRPAFAVPGRYAQAHLALPKHLEHEQKGAALEHRRSRPGTAGPHDNGLAAGEARIERPRFSRLHASIIERQSDWAWQNSFANTQAPCALERTTASRAGVGLSAAKLWFGGIALALLAAGVISAVATVQSGRILRFDAWTRSDLMWLAGVVPGALAPDSRGAYGVAAAPGRELIVAPPAADRAAGEVDAAIASPPDAQPADVGVAILGPILASAAGAAQVAAEWPVPPTAAQAWTDSRSERLLLEPPRPVLKPTLVSSFQPTSEPTARRRSRP